MRMTYFKAITTVTWCFQSNKSFGDALQQAKDQVEQLVVASPHGPDFENFDIQVGLARMKDRKRLIHLGTFEIDDVLPFITVEETKRDYEIGGKIYAVKMNSDRYHVFKRSNKCFACELEGTKMILDINPGDQRPHFNLYGEEFGRLVLMTKDHIVPKSKNGRDDIGNYVPMCSLCNNLKGNYNLTYEQIKELRLLWSNPNKLPRKELREILNKRRDEMAAQTHK